MHDVYDVIRDLRGRQVDAALCTVIKAQGSTPGREAFKMVVDAAGNLLAGTVGGGCVEADVLQEAKEAIAEGQPRLCSQVLTEKKATEQGLICGGRVEVFIEPLLFHRVLIFGGGHVGAEIEALARHVGFHTTVIDDRAEFAGPDRFPDAGEVLCMPFDDWREQVTVGAQTYIIIVTRGHQHDETVLRLAVGAGARYIGVMGSTRKLRKIVDRLGDSGVPRDLLDAVHAPIGVDIGSRTPEEIAVSVVAEIVSVKNARHVGKKRCLKEEKPEAGAATGSKERQPAKS